MVIGHGMVARRFFEAYEGKKNIVIFASGVSNSKSNDSNAYQKEKNLVQNTLAENPERIFVYFSTCSIYDPDEANSVYVLHKIDVERHIRQTAKHYLIFRVSNIVGSGGNKNTLLNFFHYHLTNEINIDLWTSASRNFIDIDDVYTIIDHILSEGAHMNKIIDVANPDNSNVEDIITTLESVLGIKGNYVRIARGGRYKIDITTIKPVIEKLGIPFGENYLEKLIKKYYSRP